MGGGVVCNSFTMGNANPQTEKQTIHIYHLHRGEGGWEMRGGVGGGGLA